MFSQLFSIIAPVFICAGIGFVWARMGRPYDAELVTALAVSIGTPCLVFSTLAEVKLEPAAVGAMAGAAATGIAVCGLIGWGVVRAARLSPRSFVPSLMLPNTGNMGLPLSLLAFGEDGLALAIAVFTVMAVTQFTAGAAIASGSVRLADMARMPLLYAVAVALAFLLTGTKPPAWLANTTEILGGMTIPLMLVTLGISLARLSVASLRVSLAMSVLRLFLGFVVAVGLAALLGFEGTERGVLILQLSMPVAVFNYLFAQRYQTAPEEVAGMVVISTALSFLTLPALLWYVL